ncbi:unnamed protein product [Trichobilharzia regenti]|nr:unnamed protein product [Trichobilharzia regenti]
MFMKPAHPPVGDSRSKVKDDELKDKVSSFLDYQAQLASTYSSIKVSCGLIFVFKA